MSLSVTGKAQVYKIDVKDKFVAASLRTSKKNKQTDEWESEFFNAKFVGKAVDNARGLTDKAKINIINGLLENRKFNDKQYISVVVFEFEVLEQGENLTKFEDVELPDDLPF